MRAVESRQSEAPDQQSGLCVLCSVFRLGWTGPTSG
jgi:hypothetical protein